jgi:hypothetical protein
MKASEFLDQKRALQDKLQAYKDSINQEWTDLENEYTKEHSPWKIDQVYERTKKGNFKYTRFVPYVLDTYELGSKVGVRAGGWWLNGDQVPEKWDTLMITGCTPLPEMQLSNDQNHKPHPKDKHENSECLR